MEENRLEKGNELIDKIEFCKDNLSNIKYTQYEDFVIRETFFSCSGKIDVTVPANLMRAIGKLITAEYIVKIEELQKEFDEL